MFYILINEEFIFFIWNLNEKNINTINNVYAVNS